MTPLQIKHQIERAEEAAERNGFRLDIGNTINIVATAAPFMPEGIVALDLVGFSDVITFFAGYELRKNEQLALDRMAKQ